VTLPKRRMCRHNQHLWDCHDCMREYQRNQKRKHADQWHKHGSEVWRDLAVRPWRTV
jgi:hypothetical protein